jgi:hypothetical protein
MKLYSVSTKLWRQGNICNLTNLLFKIPYHVQSWNSKCDIENILKISDGRKSASWTE